MHNTQSQKKIIIHNIQNQRENKQLQWEKEAQDQIIGILKSTLIHGKQRKVTKNKN